MTSSVCMQDFAGSSTATTSCQLRCTLSCTSAYASSPASPLPGAPAACSSDLPVVPGSVTPLDNKEDVDEEVRSCLLPVCAMMLPGLPLLLASPSPPMSLSSSATWGMSFCQGSARSAEHKVRACCQLCDMQGTEGFAVWGMPCVMHMHTEAGMPPDQLSFNWCGCWYS